MRKWGRYDGVTAEYKEQDECPGADWFEVHELPDDEDFDTKRRSALKDLRWRCDICHDERPDEKIDVAKHVHIFPRGFAMQHNVKFCNDRDDCRAKALIRTHFDQSIAEIELEQSRTERKLKNIKRGYPALAISSFAGGAGTMMLLFAFDVLRV